MDKKKGLGMSAAIYVIIFAVFNLLVFLLIGGKNGVFWLSYAFACLTFIVQIASMYLALKGWNSEAMFMGIPLASLSFYYFFAGLFVAVVFMIFHNAPFKLALVLQILILAIYAVVAILAIMSRDAVEAVNNNVQEKVTQIKTFNVDVDVLIPQVSDPALKKALKKVSETIKYSDPMSNDAVADIEEQIMAAANELRVNVENSNNAGAIQSCKDIEVLFLQRNNLLKATK